MESALYFFVSYWRKNPNPRQGRTRGARSSSVPAGGRWRWMRDAGVDEGRWRWAAAVTADGRAAKFASLAAPPPEPCDASLRLGCLPRGGRQCFDPPRNGRGQRGLGRGRFRVGSNRTRGYRWAGIKSRLRRSTRVHRDWAEFPAGPGLTEQGLRDFVCFKC
jgi:hypothetical protein